MSERNQIAATGRDPVVFGYCRASTKKQTESPEIQKDHIKKYATFHNLGDVTYYVDSAQSGAIRWQEREAGSVLLDNVQRGDHVVIAKLDRAFRRLADCVFVLEKFERLGVKLHVCNLMGGAIDLSSPMGRFMIHILAAFAELERAYIQERTREGIKKRKKTGIRHTRFPGYGFKWDARRIDGKYHRVRVPDEDERNVMRSIVAWRMQEQPMSWREIKDHLVFNLQLKTKEGKDWDECRIRRCCKAELMLQLREQRGLTGI